MGSEAGTLGKPSGRVTAWFPAHIKPLRAGYYEVCGPMLDHATLMHWNGRFWGDWHANPFGSGRHYVDHGFGSQPGDMWRGSLEREV